MRKFGFYILFIFSIIFGTENRKLGQTGFQFLSVTSDARSGGIECRLRRNSRHDGLG